MIVLPRHEDNKCENIIIHEVIREDNKYIKMINTWR